MWPGRYAAGRTERVGRSPEWLRPTPLLRPAPVSATPVTGRPAASAGPLLAAQRTRTLTARDVPSS